VVLITIEKRAVDCRVELDGQDISGRLCRVEIDADVNAGGTLVRLTLRDDVIIAGTPGHLEFYKPKRRS
jgi:hypothetical protein